MTYLANALPEGPCLKTHHLPSHLAVDNKMEPELIDEE